MIKVEVLKEFTLGRFNELKNLERKSKKNSKEGSLYVGDTFECDEEMANYLGGNNDYNNSFIRIIEIIPDNEEPVEEPVEEVKEEITKNKKKK